MLKVDSEIHSNNSIGFCNQQKHLVNYFYVAEGVANAKVTII